MPMMRTKAPSGRACTPYSVSPRRKLHSCGPEAEEELGDLHARSAGRSRSARARAGRSRSSRPTTNTNIQTLMTAEPGEQADDARRRRRSRARPPTARRSPRLGDRAAGHDLVAEPVVACRVVGAGCRRRGVVFIARRSLQLHDRRRPRRGRGVGVDHVVDGRRHRRDHAGRSAASHDVGDLRPSAMPPGEEGLDGHLVGGAEPRRRRAAGPAGLVGQAEAAERRRGRAARSRAGRSVGPVDAPERRADPVRVGRGRSRSAGACRAC